MKTIKAEELPVNLSALDFLQSLDVSEEVLFEASGEPRVVLMSPQSLQERREARSRLFATIERIRSQNPLTDSDEIQAELDEEDRVRRSAS